MGGPKPGRKRPPKEDQDERLEERIDRKDDHRDAKSDKWRVRKSKKNIKSGLPYDILRVDREKKANEP